MRISAASAIGSGASLVAGIAVPIAFPHLDPSIGRWLLVLAVALAALALGLWFPQRKGSAEGGTTVTTTGPHSPGIGSARDVHIYNHPPAAALQELKQAVSPGPRLPRLSSPNPERDTPFADALMFASTGSWTASIDHVDPELWQERKRDIEELAADGKLSVWGKRFVDSPVADMIDRVYEPIPAEFWRDGTVNWLQLPHGRAETEERDWHHPLDKHYHELMVSRAEVEARWPAPLRTTNDGKPDGRPIQPVPDLQLNGVLVLVYKYLGGAPEDPARKREFYRKVDLVIQDKIVEQPLHVWGRFGRRARQRLSERSLKLGWLIHREGKFYAPTMDADPMEFTDLQFNRAEVLRAWPPSGRDGE